MSPFAALPPRWLLRLRYRRQSKHTDRYGVDQWPCIDHHWHRKHALRREDYLTCRRLHERCLIWDASNDEAALRWRCHHRQRFCEAFSIEAAAST